MTPTSKTEPLHIAPWRKIAALNRKRRWVRPLRMAPLFLLVAVTGAAAGYQWDGRNAGMQSREQRERAITRCIAVEDFSKLETLIREEWRDWSMITANLRRIASREDEAGKHARLAIRHMEATMGNHKKEKE